MIVTVANPSSPGQVHAFDTAAGRSICGSGPVEPVFVLGAVTCHNCIRVGWVTDRPRLPTYLGPTYCDRCGLTARHWSGCPGTS